LVPCLCLVLLGIVGWTFWPSLQCQFLIADDQPYVLENAQVKDGITWPNIAAAFTSLGNSNWHPVTWLSHMLDCQMYGLNPKGHHFTNVLIHGCNVMLVFLVLRRLTGKMWLSWLVALLFGIHPLRVQSVTWISERKDVLSLFFWMLTIWAYACFAEATDGREKKAKYFYGLTFLFLVLGLMSKTMLVTMPFVFLLLDYWPLNRWEKESAWKLVKEKLPFFLPIILVGILSYKAQQLGGMTVEMSGLPFGYRIENAFVSYVRYLGKLFWPVNLCLCYPHPGKWPPLLAIGAVLVIAIISVLMFAGRRRAPYAFVGWSWYLGTLVPVIGVVQLGSQSMADRYTYIPIIGIMVALVWGLYELTKRWRPGVVMASIGAAGLSVACIVRTRDEIRYWQNDVTVWNHAILVTEDNFMAHYKLGLALWSAHLRSQAVAHYEEAVKINPEYALAQKMLGSALGNEQRYHEAMNHFKKGLELAPDDAQGWRNYGLGYCKLGRLNEALVYSRKSLEFGTNISTLTQIEAILEMKAQAKQQNAELRAALANEPDGAEANNNLGWFLCTSLSEEERNGNEAIQLAAHACELTKNDPICVMTLATAYAETEQYDKATATAEYACSLEAKTGNESALKYCQQLLDLFRRHEPWYTLSIYNNVTLKQ